MAKAPPNLIGQRYTRLLVVGITEYRKRRRFVCDCDCGAVVVASASELRLERVKSCGCWRRDNNRGKRPIHGDAAGVFRALEYKSWCMIIARCENPNTGCYASYGGRGITVCRRWRFGDGTRTGYECFLADVGRRPTPHHSIDRIDNNGNYEPSNCRWATPSEQMLNTRTNRLVSVFGQTLPFTEAHRRFGVVGMSCAWMRLNRGMAPIDALTAPIMRPGRRKGVA